MAEDESRATFSTHLQLDGPSLWRLGRWGVAAIAAVTLALLIGSSETGLRRIALAVANMQGAPAPPQSRDNGEMVRLSETLKKITDDRDRLLARLDALDHKFDDLTGSIALNYTPPRPAEIVLPPPAESTIVPVTVPPNVPSSAPSIIPSNAPSNVPLNAPLNAPANIPVASNPASITPQSPSIPSAQDIPPADTPAATKVDFGVDLGSAPTIEGLRALWTSAKGRHGVLLEGLRPIIALREHTKPGNVELRLVVGPLSSAALAARLCVVITATGSLCQPAVFDGQRLALR